MNFPSRHQARRRHDRCTKRRGLRLESLEERRLLTVLTVDTDLDVVDAADGLTSLREAIDMANSLAGADEIVFDFGHDGPATIRLEHGELQLTEAAKITGAGPALLTIDAQQQSRILNITAEDGDFAIEGLTLTNGQTAESQGFGDTTSNGGAIRAITSGLLTIYNSAVTNSSSSSTRPYSFALGVGGGVFAVGNLTVNSSKISGNLGFSGGGIYAQQVTVSSSAITGNRANAAGSGIVILRGSGGGISAGNVTVSSSTISDNTAWFGRGGGISADTITVNSSTISGNSGRGIVCSGNVTILNSILAGNKDNNVTPTHPDLSRESSLGTLTIQHSLIGDNRGTDLPEAPLGSPDANGNLIGGPVGGIIDPLLGPLADNGGLTLTHALLPGSPAIDSGDPLAVAGSNDVLQFDQRDAPYSRIAGGRIDIGSFESQVAPVDFNHDNQLSCSDVDALVSAVIDGLNPPEFDLTTDDIVDQADLDVWLALAGLANLPSGAAYMKGDANLDGKVDASDLNVIASNWQDAAVWCGGDFNADGVTNAKDLNQLALNWFLDESGEVAAATRPQAPRAPLANAAVLDDDHSRGPRSLTDSCAVPWTADGFPPERFTTHSLIGHNRGSTLSEAPEVPPADGNLIGGPVSGGIVRQLRARDRVDHATQSRWSWARSVDDLLGSDVDVWQRE